MDEVLSGADVCGGSTLDSGRAQIEREGTKGYGGPVWRWRKDLSRFAVMEKQLCTHSTSRLAVGDQGHQRERWYGSCGLTGLYERVGR